MAWVLFARGFNFLLLLILAAENTLLRVCFFYLLSTPTSFNLWVEFFMLFYLAGSLLYDFCWSCEMLRKELLFIDFSCFIAISASRYFFRKSRLGGQARVDKGKDWGMEFAFKNGSCKISYTVGLLEGSNWSNLEMKFLDTSERLELSGKI